MSSLLELYRKRNLNTSLNNAFATKSTVDPRMWNVSRDDKGNGSGTIRFLPFLGGDTEFVTVQSYRFTNPTTGRTYSEKSLTTIGKPDPVQEYWAALWQAGRKDEAKLVSRNINYYANIYVVKDGAKPDNNGTVRIFRFGRTIKDMLDDARQSDRGGLPSINAFCLESYPRNASDAQIQEWINANPTAPGEPRYPGANFILRVKSRGGEQNFPTYEGSTWESPSALGPDAFIEDVLGKAHDLNEFIRPDTFKSYDELKEIFNDVMWGGNVPPQTIAAPATQAPLPAATATDSSIQGDVDFLMKVIQEAR